MSAPFPTLNLTRPSVLLTYNNTVTDGMFGTILLSIIFIICFVSMKNYPTAKAFTAASFITATLAGLFFAFNIVNGYVLFIFAIFTALGVVGLQIKKE